MDAFDIVDWRRRVFQIYAQVRAMSDRAAAHRLWCHTRDQLFRTHPASPLLLIDRRSFSGLPVPAYDPTWRFQTDVKPAPSPRRIELVTGTDGVVPFEQLGVAHIPRVGQLAVWRLATYGGGLFVPVKDASAATRGGTYGGGRYLIDTAKGADLGFDGTQLVLDFNFTYNPSCAYDPAWTCPLPQSDNAVNAEIPVGERAHVPGERS